MTVRIRPFAEEWQAPWAGVTEANARAMLAHAEQWLSVLSGALGHRDRSLVAERGGEVCGVLPMMQVGRRPFGIFHVSLPWLDYGGVLAESPEVARALLDAATAQARADGTAFIELRSVEALFADLPGRDDKVTLRLDLGDSDAIWKHLDPKVRNQVRKAEKAGLTCEFGRDELLPEFYRVFATNMRDLGTPVWPVGLFRNILQAFPKTSEIVLVRLGRRAIGGGLVIAFKDTVYMPSASSLRRYFPLCPNNLLYWEVIRRACEGGYRTFDFGRSTVDSGTYHFKKQWGAAVTPLRWQYVLLKGDTVPRLNPSNPRLKVLAQAWKWLPLGIANRLGPRIVKHLP